MLRMPSSAAYAHGLPATIISWHIHFSPIFFGTHGREHNLALPERKNSVRLRHLAHAPLPSCDGCEGRVSATPQNRGRRRAAPRTQGKHKGMNRNRKRNSRELMTAAAAASVSQWRIAQFPCESRGRPPHPGA